MAEVCWLELRAGVQQIPYAFQFSVNVRSDMLNVQGLL